MKTTIVMFIALSVMLVQNVRAECKNVANYNTNGCLQALGGTHQWECSDNNNPGFTQQQQQDLCKFVNHNNGQGESCCEWDDSAPAAAPAPAPAADVSTWCGKKEAINAESPDYDSAC